MLKRVCCRCLKVLDSDPTQDTGVTHTICLDCVPAVYPYEVASVSEMTTEMLEPCPPGWSTWMRTCA